MEMAAFALVAVPTNTLHQSPQILCISSTPHKYSVPARMYTCIVFKKCSHCSIMGVEVSTGSKDSVRAAAKIRKLKDLIESSYV